MYIRFVILIDNNNDETIFKFRTILKYNTITE